MDRRSISLASSFCCFLSVGTAAAQNSDVGLSVDRAQTFENENLFYWRPEPYDFFAKSLATGDFNGDGVQDLATGIPWDEGAAGWEVNDSGIVVVRYGVAGSGLETGLADTVLSQQDYSSPDPAEPGDLFGYALAAGDFNGDGFDDLAVGVPGDVFYYGGPNSPYWIRWGGVAVYLGAIHGLDLLSPRFTTGPQPHQTEFGSSLAAGDFNGDGFDDVAVGGPGYLVQGSPPNDTGLVIVYPGNTAFSFFDPIFMRQGYFGLPDVAESGDRFGESVAAADFDGDGFDDLAIGAPGEDGAGAVMVVFGSPNWINVDPDDRFWREGDLGRPGELDDRFGETLATGDFDGDGYDDLAIGASNEDVFNNDLGNAIDAGAVTVLQGAAPGFDLGRTRYIDQAFGAPTDVESQPSDHFGWALAAGDFDLDGHDDLAVGHYGEGSPGGFDVGAVTVLMGSAASGLDVDRRRRFQPGVDGLPGGVPDVQRYFGHAVAAGDFDNDGAADLAIGAPLQDAGGLTSAGNEVVLYGSPALEPGGVYVFSSLELIRVPAPGTTSGPGDPYPAEIVVDVPSSEVVRDLDVTLSGIFYPRRVGQLDVLLVSPRGDTLVLVSDACDGHEPLFDATWTFDDEAVAFLPELDNGDCGFATVRPTNHPPAESFPSPAPPPSTATDLSIFDGSDPNGVWRLFMIDDQAGGLLGRISGWSLRIETTVP